MPTKKRKQSLKQRTAVPERAVIRSDTQSVVAPPRDDIAFARLRGLVKKKAAAIEGVKVAYVSSDCERFFMCADSSDGSTRRAVSQAIVEIERDIGRTLDGHFAPTTKPIEEFTVVFSR